MFKLLISFAFVAFATAPLHGDQRDRGPDRTPAPPERLMVRYTPLDLGAWAAPQGWRLTGAWRVEAETPRLAGLSALLAGEGSALTALTDSGVLVELSGEGQSGPSLFRDLPTGPGDPHYRRFRDAEAALRHGGRLWVAFENRHSLWSFGTGGPSAMTLPSCGWPRNAGIEAMVLTGDGVLLLPEEDSQLLHLSPSGQLTSRRLTGRTGGIADATRLPDGRILVAVREVGLGGLRNRLAWLERARGGYRLRPFTTLPLGSFDNVEGLAARRDGRGRTTMWAVTDNDGWRRSLLLRVEIDATKAPATAGASVD